MKNHSISGSIKRFLELMKLDRRDLYGIYLLAFLIGLVQLSLPLGIQTIISFVLGGTVSVSIVVLIIMVLAGTFVAGMLQVKQLQIIEKIKQKILVRFAMAFSDKLTKVNPEKYDHIHLPELVNRYFDIFSLQKGLDKVVLEFPTALIQVILGLTLLSFYHAVFIGFGVVLILIVVLILRYTSASAFASAYEASNYKYQLGHWLQNLAKMARSFKYSKGTEHHLTQTDSLATSYLKHRIGFFSSLLIQFWSLISFKLLVTAAMLIVGVVLLVEQKINVGQFIAADIVIITIITSVEKLIISLDKIYEALVSIEKLSFVTELDNEIDGGIELSDSDQGCAVYFEQVNFSYPDVPNVLHNLSFTAEPGQILQIKGHSGTGKSSIIKLLTGSYSHYTGNIIIDQLPIANYSLSSLRKNTGVLFSNEDLFPGTIFENLTLGSKRVDMNQLLHLVAKLELEHYIRDQKLGLETYLPHGFRMPAQLRQKILLIRALLGHPRLILLEEPFRFLSTSETNNIMRVLSQEIKSTIIIASNEESISAFCDKILELKKN